MCKKGVAALKVTPVHDLSWYIKWIASFILIGAIACRSAGFNELDIYLSFVGILGWGVVGWLWHDRALVLVNGVAGTILLIAMLRLI